MALPVFVSVGSVGTGTTSVTAGTPSSLATGDGVLIMVVSKTDTSTINTPAGWTLVADVAGGGGTSGNSAGPSHQAWFFREKDASWSTVPAVSITSGTAGAAIAARYTKTSGNTWDIAAATGSYGVSATTTNMSTTLGSNPGLQAGDAVIGGFSKMTASTTTSAESFSATGVSVWGTVTEQSDVIQSTSQPRIGGVVFTGSVTTGTASAAPVMNGTSNSATRGTAVLVRLREVTGTTSKTGSESPAITITESSSIVVSPQSAGGGGGGSAPVAANVATNGWSGASSTVSRPAGTVDGDLLIAANASDWDTLAGNGLPAGFTVLTTSQIDGGTNNPHVAIGWKIASSEPSSYTFPGSSGSSNVGTVIRITGADSAPTIAQVAPTSTVTSPSITPNGATDLLLVFFCADTGSTGARSWAPPAGLTEIVDAQSSDLYTSLSVNFQQNPSSPSGTFTGNPDSGFTKFASTAISIAPQAGFGPPGDTAAITITESSFVDTSGGATPVSASQSVAITITESKSLAGSSTSTDTSAVTVTESRAITVSSTSTDTAAITVTESKALAGSSTSTETCAITIVESSSLVITNAVSASDASAITIAESRILAGSSTSTDTAAITIAESRAINSSSASTDTTAISISETKALASSSTSSDTSAITISETSSIAVAQSSTDTAAITITESSNAFNNQPGADSAGIGIAETSSVLVTFSSTDTTAIGISDTSAVANTQSSSDTAAISVSETSSIAIINALATNDSSAITITESSAVLKQIPTTDTAAITVSESRSIASSSSSTDTAAITISETSAVAKSSAASDTCAITISESSSVLVTLSRTDTAAISVADVSSSALSLSRTDTSSISVSEASSIASQAPGHETIAVSVTEQSSILVTLSGTDTAAITTAETALSAVDFSSTDSASISVSESAHQEDVIPGTQIWVYASGAWKTGTFFVWKDGVWKTSTPWFRENDSWV